MAVPLVSSALSNNLSLKRWNKRRGQQESRGVAGGARKGCLRMGLVRFALRFPHTFYVVAAAIVFLGVAAISTMPADIFPQINIPVVSVIWQYTGLSTPEMEQRVST